MLSTLVLGTILGFIQYKHVPVLSNVIDFYVLTMRGIPPLVVLLLLFFTWNLSTAFLTAFLALTIYHTAYILEIVRGGCQAIPKGQMEAGKSLGLGYFSIMLKVYLPQIILPIIPSLCGQYILVVKDTTLVSVVGVQDIMWNARQLMEITFNPMIVYILIGIFFYLLCLIIEVIGKRAEKMTPKMSRLKA
jgi:His/Glu/Gln/Arg/opine family amino acid ABC transporter permease subunit